MEKKQKPPKEKRRNMERRKEKSRDAARCRRSKEHEIFTDLYSMLPLSKMDSVSHLDKASIIRIAISYLKIRSIVQPIPISANDENKYEIRTRSSTEDSLFLNALEGFLLVTTSDGDIVFISENVNRYLGLSQVDLLGQSIYELSHPCDHAEIKEMLSTKETKTNEKSHFLRMKCTLTSKGRNVNIKSASYKVIRYSGRMIECKNQIRTDTVKKELIESEDSDDENSLTDQRDNNLSENCLSRVGKTGGATSFHFVAVGEPISHPANIEIPLGLNTFLSKHSLDMKFTYADERIVDFFGYQPNSLLKKSVFDYHHAQDSICVRECFKSLFQKGQSQTERYRFLASGGGYAWVLTQATVIYDDKSQKPHSVVCVNFVISGIENPDEVYSLSQLEERNRRQQQLETTGIADTVENNNKSLCEKKATTLVYPKKSLRNEDENHVGYHVQKSPQRLIEKLTINGGTFSSSPKTENVVAVDSSVDDLLGPITHSDQKASGRVDLPLSAAASVWLINGKHEKGNMEDSLEETTAEDKTKKYGGLIDENLPLKSSSSIAELPKPSTLNVFVPVTEDMNKGFLGFAEGDTGLTVWKEDAEDLTHLAPTAGDVCVPLDETAITCVPPDMFDDFMLPDCDILSGPGDGTGPIVEEDAPITSRSSSTSPHSASQPLSSYFTYRDELEPSSRPHSPILSQNEDYALPSFRDNSSPLRGDNFLNEIALMDTTNDDIVDNLSGKSASLLPLTLEQDPLLPFVTNDNFVWGTASEDSSAWSSMTNSPDSNCSLLSNPERPSSLAKLLITEPICNYDSDGGRKDEDRLTKCFSKTSKRASKMTPFEKAAAFTEMKTVLTSNRSPDQGYSSGDGKGYADMVVYRCTDDSSGDCRATNIAEGMNNRMEEKRCRNTADIIVGSKRSMSENWGRTNPCKRSRQTTLNRNAPAMDGKRYYKKANFSLSQQQQNTNVFVPQDVQTLSPVDRGSSVLLNLLVNGCDSSAGYNEEESRAFSKNQEQENFTTRTAAVKPKNNSIGVDRSDGRERASSFSSSPSSIVWAFQNKNKIVGLFDPESTQIPSLMDLTEQDYAVNAPSSGELLHGFDLLKALERPAMINLR